MFSYYGAKTNIVNYYPTPKFNKIIEPFAGSARYALKYFDRDVLLVDKYEVIINIWKWLQKCSPKDILGLPRMKQGDHVDNFNFDCQEAKDLMGFVIGFMTESPRKTGTIRLTQRSNHVNYTLNKIALNIYKIKHWKIECDDYLNVPNQTATWFIDPPYIKGGHVYKHHTIDYKQLSSFCNYRQGQIIVCESYGADWLDFKHMVYHKTRSGFQNEVIYSNYPTEFDNIQLKLF